MSRQRSVILGLTAFHGDSSAALVVDGELVAAAEEERFTRVKHTAAFPRRAIAYCLNHAGLDAGSVTTVACPGLVGATVPRRLLHAVRHPAMALRAAAARRGGQRARLDEALAAAGLEHARLMRFEHHLAHMASVQPLLAGQRGTLVTIDGLGDFASASHARASTGVPTIAGRIYFPDSLGFFYTALTQHLGFRKFGEEFKVMGLSSFGRPRFAEQLRGLVERRSGFGFRLDRRAFTVASRGVPFRVENDQPVIGLLHDEAVIAKALGVPARNGDEPLTELHADVASSLQLVFEEIADHLVAAALEVSTETGALGLAGGCAHNSVWVGKLRTKHRIGDVFVAPASHDAGLAVGAAVLAAGGTVRCAEKHWALLGPAFDEPGRDLPKGKTFPDDAALHAWLAGRLAAGGIVGLFHGRLEFGPRALGSRSILCDPRPAAMRDRLNARVKHREAFRPFAAVVLAEKQEDWFVGSFRVPTMEAVFPVRDHVKERIGAVVHSDGSCRIQTVERDVQPFLWALIHAFETQTGVPMLINTSFNDSEPIVCTPTDALACFRRTEMDHLVIGRTVFSRHDLDLAEPERASTRA